MGIIIASPAGSAVGYAVTVGDQATVNVWQGGGAYT